MPEGAALGGVGSVQATELTAGLVQLVVLGRQEIALAAQALAVPLFQIPETFQDGLPLCPGLFVVLGTEVMQLRLDPGLQARLLTLTAGHSRPVTGLDGQTLLFTPLPPSGANRRKLIGRIHEAG